MTEKEKRYLSKEDRIRYENLSQKSSFFRDEEREMRIIEQRASDNVEKAKCRLC